MSAERLVEIIVQRSVDLAGEISPVFVDRTEAGIRLASALSEQKYQNSVLFTIPSGGVPVAVSISNSLGLQIHLSFAAKVRFSTDRRFGIGAVSTKEVILNQELINDLSLDKEVVKQRVKQAKQILREKIEAFSDINHSTPDLSGKTVILAEDGVATGFTVLAAAKRIESLHPKRIVIASPVTSNLAYERIGHHGYEQVVLVKPDSETFLVDKFYHNFPRVTLSEARLALTENNIIESVSLV